MHSFTPRKTIATGIVLAITVTACSATLAEQALATANAVAMCVAPIVLDVTGLASEDPVEIAQECAVAIVDVYNYVVQEIAAAKAGGGDASADASTPSMSSEAGAGTPTTLKASSGQSGRHYTAAQVSRLERIRDKAAALLGKDGGT